MMDEKAVLSRLGFKHNEEKNYFYKAIIPSGDPRGSRYVLYYRDGEFWTQPKMKKESVEYLGEVLLFRKHMEGEIDIFGLDLSQPIPLKVDGIQRIAELSLTPEEAEKMFAEKPKKEEKQVKEEKKEEKAEDVDHFAIIQKLTGYDIFEIFSDSGTGKSKIVIEIARNAIKHNHKTFFYDTEGNITEEEAKAFGNNYRYDPTMEGLLNFKFPDWIDLLIIDSVTYPFWIQFASMNLKQRGEALLSLHAFLGKLKAWCVKNKKVAIIVSQATSELGAENEEKRKPWGGKAFHIAKEIVKPELIYSEPNETFVKMVAYRMRRYGRGFELADVIINNRGVYIKWKIKL